MTPLLQRAFAAASTLPIAEQDALAALLLAEIDAETQFDEKLATTGAKLAGLAQAALNEHQAGQTLTLEPESL